MKPVKIAIAGEGGQGVQTIGELLSDAAYVAGQQTIYIPNFGVEQRGGVSIAFVQIADERIGSPKFAKADLMVVLSQRSVDRTKNLIQPSTIYLYDSSAIEAPVVQDATIGIQCIDTAAPEAFADTMGRKAGEPAHPPQEAMGKVVAIPAAETAKQELNPRVFNIIILGAIVHLVPSLSLDQMKKSIERKLGGKFKDKPELRELNMKALERGFALAAQS